MFGYVWMDVITRLVIKRVRAIYYLLDATISFSETIESPYSSISYLLRLSL